MGETKRPECMVRMFDVWRYQTNGYYAARQVRCFDHAATTVRRAIYHLPTVRVTIDQFPDTPRLPSPQIHGWFFGGSTPYPRKKKLLV